MHSSRSDVAAVTGVAKRRSESGAFGGDGLKISIAILHRILPPILQQILLGAQDYTEPDAVCNSSRQTRRFISR